MKHEASSEEQIELKSLELATTEEQAQEAKTEPKIGARDHSEEQGTVHEVKVKADVSVQATAQIVTSP